MNIAYKRKLPSAREVQEMYPLKTADKKQKAQNDEEISKVFTGEDDRLVLIIGPCSADREDAVLEYRCFYGILPL